MNALKIADTAEDKKKLDAKCKELLTKAEQIKQSKSECPIHRDSASNDSRPRSSEPVSTRELSTREQIILLEGAKLNGFVFPPWGTAPVPQEFELIDGDEPYVYVSKTFSALIGRISNLFRDSPELPLSPLQREIFGGWKRPRDLVSSSNFTAEYKPTSALTMAANSPVDLVQDVTTDCSVVASLCAAISRAERGYSKVYHSLIATMVVSI